MLILGSICVHPTRPLLPVDHGPEHLNSPANTYYQARPVITCAPFMGDVTLAQGSFGT